MPTGAPVDLHDGWALIGEPNAIGQPLRLPHRGDEPSATSAAVPQIEMKEVGMNAVRQLGYGLLAAALLAAGCASKPTQKPRILSSYSPPGAVPAPPLNTTRQSPVQVPSAPVRNAPVAVPAIAAPVVVPGPPPVAVPTPAAGSATITVPPAPGNLQAVPGPTGAEGAPGSRYQTPGNHTIAPPKAQDAASESAPSRSLLAPNPRDT